MIRPAQNSDFGAIAELQIASWRSAYKGILSESYLDHQVQLDLTEKWAKHQTAALDVLLVHEKDGHLTGFINVLNQRPPYVDNLHVHPSHRSSGVGAALIKAAGQSLMASGRQQMWLTVITSNIRAIKFYESMGARRGEPLNEKLYGQSLMAFPMRWNDLSILSR